MGDVKGVPRYDQQRITTQFCSSTQFKESFSLFYGGMSFCFLQPQTLINLIYNSRCLFSARKALTSSDTAKWVFTASGLT